jgi:hypothetical protein
MTDLDAILIHLGLINMNLSLDTAMLYAHQAGIIPPQEQQTPRSEACSASCRESEALLW